MPRDAARCSATAAPPRLLPVVGAAAVPPSPANQMLRVPAGNLTPNGVPTAGIDGVGGNYSLYGAIGGAWDQAIDRQVARVNRAFFFRRALKLVNGGRGELPTNGSQGLTVAAENPVYIEGNYNACTNNIDQLTDAGTAAALQRRQQLRPQPAPAASASARRPASTTCRPRSSPTR